MNISGWGHFVKDSNGTLVIGVKNNVDNTY
jgi:hypothetical protein